MTQVGATFKLNIDPETLAKLRQIRKEANLIKQSVSRLNRVKVAPKIERSAGGGRSAGSERGLKRQAQQGGLLSPDQDKWLGRSANIYKKVIKGAREAEQRNIALKKEIAGVMKQANKLQEGRASLVYKNMSKDAKRAALSNDRLQKSMVKSILSLTKTTLSNNKLRQQVEKVTESMKKLREASKYEDKLTGIRKAKEEVEKLAKAARKTLEQQKKLNAEMGEKGVQMAVRASKAWGRVSKVYGRVAKRSRGIVDFLQKKGINIMPAVEMATVAQANLGDYARQAVIWANAAKAFQAVLGATNMWTNLENKVRLVTKGYVDQAINLQKLQETAQHTWTDLSALSVTFQRTKFAMDKMGMGASDAQKVVRALATAVKTTGISAHEATGGLRQITQALNKGKLDGDEFRSVSENMPIVMDAIAKAAGRTRAQLFEMSRAGLLTNKLVVKGLIQALPDLEKQLGKVRFTTADAWVQIKNAFTGLAGQFERTYGWTKSLVEYMQKFAKGIETVSFWIGKWSGMSQADISERMADESDVRIKMHLRYKRIERELIQDQKGLLDETPGLSGSDKKKIEDFSKTLYKTSVKLTNLKNQMKFAKRHNIPLEDTKGSLAERVTLRKTDRKLRAMTPAGLVGEEAIRKDPELEKKLKLYIANTKTIIYNKELMDKNFDELDDVVKKSIGYSPKMKGFKKPFLSTKTPVIDLDRFLREEMKDFKGLIDAFGVDTPKGISKESAAMKVRSLLTNIRQKRTEKGFSAAWVKKASEEGNQYVKRIMDFEKELEEMLKVFDPKKKKKTKLERAQDRVLGRLERDERTWKNFLTKIDKAPPEQEVAKTLDKPLKLGKTMVKAAVETGKYIKNIDKLADPITAYKDISKQLKGRISKAEKMIVKLDEDKRKQLKSLKDPIKQTKDIIRVGERIIKHADEYSDIIKGHDKSGVVWGRIESSLKDRVTDARKELERLEKQKEIANEGNRIHKRNLRLSIKLLKKDQQLVRMKREELEEEQKRIEEEKKKAKLQIAGSSIRGVGQGVGGTVGGYIGAAGAGFAVGGPQGAGIALIVKAVYDSGKFVGEQIADLNRDIVKEAEIARREKEYELKKERKTFGQQAIGGLFKDNEDAKSSSSLAYDFRHKGFRSLTVGKTGFDGGDSFSGGFIGEFNKIKSAFKHGKLTIDKYNKAMGQLHQDLKEFTKENAELIYERFPELGKIIDKQIETTKKWEHALEKSKDQLLRETEARAAAWKFEAQLQARAAQDVVNRTGIRTVTQTPQAQPPPPANLVVLNVTEDQLDDEMARHSDDQKFFNFIRRNPEVEDFVS